MKVVSALGLAAWIDEIAERFGAVAVAVAPDVFPAPLDVVDRLLVDAAADEVRDRRARRAVARRLAAALVHPSLAVVLLRALRPAGPSVDPQDVGFVPHAEGAAVEVTPGEALVTCPVQRTLAWMTRANTPTVLERGAVAAGDRPVMPREYHPVRQGRRSVFERDQLREVDTDDRLVRSAVRRYETLADRLDAGEITEVGYARACAQVLRDTGVTVEEAERNSVRVPTDELAQERQLLWWLHRDDVERASEQARVRGRADAAEAWLDANDPDRAPKHFDRELAVTGMLAGSGEAGDRAWLYAKLSQIAAECTREGLRSLPVPPLEGKERTDAIRLGVSLQHRFVLRRLVDEMCDREDREFREAWSACERWRRSEGLTYAKAVEVVAAKLGAKPERHRVAARTRNTWVEVGRGTAAQRAEVV